MLTRTDIDDLKRVFAPAPPPGDFPPDDDYQAPTEYPDSAAGEPDLSGQLQPSAALLTLVCPPAWRDVPLDPMRWLATNRIPAGDVTILSGDGGGGKTTVALQLAVSVEQDLGDWLGTVCEAGPVIFFSGEEPEAEMRRRLHRTARKRGIDPSNLENLHFHFADPDACLLSTSRRDGTMAPTALFASLATAARDIRPTLIVVDSIAATFGGNQNDRVHARTFVGLFRTLARQVDCAVLLLDHPSLSGITSGTGRGGSMDWQNATRARLHLETIADEDGGTGRVLEVKKTNYGPAGEKVKLQWEDGCFVLEAAASAPHQAAVYSQANQIYLDCLDAVTAQGRHVCHAKGRGFAPKAFAEMPQANGMTWKAFQAAQERLFAAGPSKTSRTGRPQRAPSALPGRSEMSLRSACDPHASTCDPPATRLRSSYLSAFYHPAIHCDPPVFNPPTPLCVFARAFPDRAPTGCAGAALGRNTPDRTRHAGKTAQERHNPSDRVREPSSRASRCSECAGISSCRTYPGVTSILDQWWSDVEVPATAHVGRCLARAIEAENISRRGGQAHSHTFSTRYAAPRLTVGRFRRRAIDCADTVQTR
jgi:RecA-family ATPase